MTHRTLVDVFYVLYTRDVEKKSTSQWSLRVTSLAASRSSPLASSTTRSSFEITSDGSTGPSYWQKDARRKRGEEMRARCIGRVRGSGVAWISVHIIMSKLGSGRRGMRAHLVGQRGVLDVEGGAVRGRAHGGRHEHLPLLDVPGSQKQGHRKKTAGVSLRNTALSNRSWRVQLGDVQGD